MNKDACLEPGSSLLSGPNTFMGIPYSTDLNQCRAAILGIPFDCGTHPTRIGARYGPTAIRENSHLVRPFQPPHADFNPLKELAVIDCGDVNVTPGVIEVSYQRIESAVAAVADANVVPITLGGDGAVTLPQLRALHHHHPELVVLHIDAHTDTSPSSGDEIHDRFNVATTFTRAAEEGVVDPACSFHIGARGTVPRSGVFEFTQSFGYQLIDGEQLFADGFETIIHDLKTRLDGRPVYLCFDMDFFDPSCAPGVCTPTWGGASAREGLALIQALSDINFVAFDINTVSPPHDVAGMTSFLAGTVVLECLTLVCRSRGTNE